MLAQRLVPMFLIMLLSVHACAMGEDTVLQWNGALVNAVRVDKTAPPRAARNMAIVHTAVYDAVNSIEKTHNKYLADVKASSGASTAAAAAAAAHRTLVALYPAQVATFDQLLGESLAGIPSGRARQGVQVGKAVADKILAARANDGANAVVSYTLTDQPGHWQPTPDAFAFPPALPQWPYVKPFGLLFGSQFRPAGPASLESDEYTDNYNEVKMLGDVTSIIRTPDQTEIAFFWADGPGTATPPGHWNEIAQGVAIDRGQTLAENARMFALLNIGLADAGISAWDAKYVFDFWRPVTGIRAGDSDGNSNTVGDVTWTPLITTPSFPAYTSGHSTFSGCAATVLARFVGSDDFVFVTNTDDLPGVDRSFSSFSEAAEEAGQSRIYGGIHWQFDNVDGLNQGGQIGNFVVDHYLAPVKKKGPKK